jgi:hypothetical protein
MEVVIMYDQEKKKSRGEWWRMYITSCQLECIAVSVICKWFLLEVVQLVELQIRKVGSFPGRGIDRVTISCTE